jgi:hypothetical protein
MQHIPMQMQHSKAMQLQHIVEMHSIHSNRYSKIQYIQIVTHKISIALRSLRILAVYYSFALDVILHWGLVFQR